MKDEQEGRSQLQEVASQDAIDRFLTLQADELQLRREDMQTEREKNASLMTYATRALETQRDVLREQDKNDRKAFREKAILIVVVLILVLVFLGFALFTGNKDLVLEVVRAAVFLVGGGAGGYALGSRSRKHRDDDQVALDPDE